MVLGHPLVDALLGPFLDPGSRTFWGGWVSFALVALGLAARRGGGWAERVDAVFPRAAWRHPSTRLDLQLLLGRQLLRVLGAVPALAGGWYLATWVVRGLDATLGVPSLPVPPAAVPWLYTVALFVAWDASRYVLHRLMHEVPALWELHQLHHSAEVMTPLTFHRVHPVESLLYQARGGLVTALVAGGAFWLFRADATDVTLLGVHGLGLVFNVATGNLRHSHVWLRFGERVERWLVSPAQHQLHHARDAHGTNYGTWLAVWDRMGGTWRPAPETAPARLGIDAHGRNHGDDLVTAWVGPLRGAVRHLGLRAPLVATGLLLTGLARGQDDAPEGDAQGAADDPGDPDDDVPLVVIVEAEGGVPRVAGSAHVLDEEDLSRFEHDDVHRVLGAVPGVYVRGEDGYGLRPNIGIRGANSDRTAKLTLMEDGVLLAPAPYAAPAAYYFPMTTRLVGMEVFKGPAATRHGPQTVGGAINLQTRPVPRDGFDGGLDVAGGLYSTIKAHGFGGWGAPRGGILAEAVHLSTAGFKELDGGGPTGFDRSDVMLKGFVASPRGATVRHTGELKLGYGREDSDETYLGLTDADALATPTRRYAASALANMRWHRTQVEAAWQVEVGDDLDVRTVAYHHFLTRQWFKLNRFAGGPDLHTILSNPDAGQAAVFAGILRGEEDTVTPEQVLRIGTNDRTFHAFGAQSRLRWRAAKGIVLSQLEVGARVHGDDVARLHTEDPYAMTSGVLRSTGEPRITTLDSHTRALAVALHVHEDLGIGPIRLLPGVRGEVYGTDQTVAGAPRDARVWRAVVLPGMGVLGSATSWLDLFAGVHRGFSPVSPGQSEDVLPETNWAYEAGGRLAWRDTRAELVGFFDDYLNLTGQCTLSGGCTDDQLDQQFNGGRVFVWGLEAAVGQSARLPGRSRLDVDATYTWTGSRFRTGFVSGFPQFGTVEVGDRLPYVPEHRGALRVVYTHPRFGVAAGGDLRSGLRDEASQGPLDPTRDVPPLFLLDLSANAAITPHVRAYATVTNATASTAIASRRPFGARPVAPIQAMLGVKVAPPVTR